MLRSLRVTLEKIIHTQNAQSLMEGRTRSAAWLMEMRELLNPLANMRKNSRKILTLLDCGWK
jgi:hypothetical protein